MLRNPTTHRADLTVAEAREVFAASRKQHLLLLVDDGVLVSTVARSDLEVDVPGERPAAEIGTLEGRTLVPEVPLEEAMDQMEQQGLRRLAVVDPEMRLLGLLCLKRSRSGFCTDEGVAEMRRARASAQVNS